MSWRLETGKVLRMSLSGRRILFLKGRGSRGLSEALQAPHSLKWRKANPLEQARSQGGGVSGHRVPWLSPKARLVGGVSSGAGGRPTALSGGNLTSSSNPDPRVGRLVGTGCLG